MNVTNLDELLKPRGQALLRQTGDLWEEGKPLLQILDRLNQMYEPELVRASVELTELRRKARVKFRRADDLYFTREALEQASGEVIANHRAKRYARYSGVLDGCCSIGADALALAQVGCDVTAVDHDSIRVRMAKANAEALGLLSKIRFIEDDVLGVKPPEIQAAFFDPDRRPDGSRTRNWEKYSPPPPAILERFGGLTMAWKLAPATPWSDLDTFPETEVEFISHKGELKECVVWFGEFRTARRRATVIDGEGKISELCAEDVAPKRDLSEPKRYIYDPDPAITRSGLVTNLAEMLDAAPLDAEIAFVTGDELRATAFATAYEIEATLPFNRKKLNAELRSRNVGQVTFVKRGSAVDTEDLRKQLKLTGEQRCFVILTRIADAPSAIIAQRAG